MEEGCKREKERRKEGGRMEEGRKIEKERRREGRREPGIDRARKSVGKGEIHRPSER